MAKQQDPASLSTKMRFRLPSMTPIASLYAAIPLSGALIFLFTVEQLINGLRHGFDRAEPDGDARAMPAIEPWR